MDPNGRLFSAIRWMVLVFKHCSGMTRLAFGQFCPTCVLMLDYQFRNWMVVSLLGHLNTGQGKSIMAISYQKWFQILSLTCHTEVFFPLGIRGAVIAYFSNYRLFRLGFEKMFCTVGSEYRTPKLHIHLIIRLVWYSDHEMFPTF